MPPWARVDLDNLLKRAGAQLPSPVQASSCSKSSGPTNCSCGSVFSCHGLFSVRKEYRRLPDRRLPVSPARLLSGVPTELKRPHLAAGFGAHTKPGAREVFGFRWL